MKLNIFYDTIKLCVSTPYTCPQVYSPPLPPTLHFLDTLSLSTLPRPPTPPLFTVLTLPYFHTPTVPTIPKYPLTSTLPRSTCPHASAPHLSVHLTRHYVPHAPRPHVSHASTLPHPHTSKPHTSSRTTYPHTSHAPHISARSTYPHSPHIPTRPQTHLCIPALSLVTRPHALHVPTVSRPTYLRTSYVRERSTCLQAPPRTTRPTCPHTHVPKRRHAPHVPTAMSPSAATAYAVYRQLAAAAKRVVRDTITTGSSIMR